VEDKHKLSASELKAVRFENTQTLHVLVYNRNNPNILDANTKVTNKLKPAFTDELGIQYWMAYIGDGIRHNTLKVPDDFDISSRVDINMFKNVI
jgi:hypothetical protein